MIETRPLPATGNPLDQPFWSAAYDDRLMMQTCGSCSEMRFPPRPMCPQCQSEACAWQDVSREGVIWSFASPRSPLLPAFEALAPFVTIIGALRAHPAIRIAAMALKDEHGEVTGITADDIMIGQPVQLLFRRITADCALPYWLLAPPANERAPD